MNAALTGTAFPALAENEHPTGSEISDMLYLTTSAEPQTT
jgi:hypothetical protein